MLIHSLSHAQASRRIQKFLLTLSGLVCMCLIYALWNLLIPESNQVTKILCLGKVQRIGSNTIEYAVNNQKNIFEIESSMEYFQRNMCHYYHALNTCFKMVVFLWSIQDAKYRHEIRFTTMQFQPVFPAPFPTHLSYSLWSKRFVILCVYFPCANASQHLCKLFLLPSMHSPRFSAQERPTHQQSSSNVSFLVTSHHKPLSFSNSPSNQGAVKMGPYWCCPIQQPLTNSCMQLNNFN